MDDVYLKFVKKLMMSSSFCFHHHFMTCATLKLQLPQFSSNQAQIWCRGRFWGYVFQFELKKWIKHQVLMRKGIIPLILIKYCLIDGHHGNRETSILKLLVLKDSLCNYN